MAEQAGALAPAEDPEAVDPRPSIVPEALCGSVCRPGAQPIYPPPGAAYWLTLALALLAPMLPSLWRITRPDAHGTFNAATVPPLILWAFWLRAQRRPASAAAATRVS